MNTKKIHFPDATKSFRVNKKWNARSWVRFEKVFNKGCMIALLVAFFYFLWRFYMAVIQVR